MVRGPDVPLLGRGEFLSMTSPHVWKSGNFQFVAECESLYCRVRTGADYPPITPSDCILRSKRQITRCLHGPDWSKRAKD